MSIRFIEERKPEEKYNLIVKTEFLDFSKEGSPKEIYEIAGENEGVEKVFHLPVPTQIDEDTLSDIFSDGYQKALDYALDNRLSSICFDKLETGKRAPVASVLADRYIPGNLTISVEAPEIGNLQNLENDLSGYIRNNYKEKIFCAESALPNQKFIGFVVKKELSESQESELNKRLRQIDYNFSEYVTDFLENHKDIKRQVYEEGYIDRRQYGKLKNNPDYHPSKLKAMEYCIALERNLDESKDLLLRAGYGISNSDQIDIIFSYLIERKFYSNLLFDQLLYDKLGMSLSRDAK